MSTVFLSYCRSDQAEAARLAAALTDAGLDVWWDHLIEGGAAYAKRIESALEGADAVVVLWSARAIESDWVLDEAARGRELRKLVPASLDGTPSPLGFRQYQTVDLTRWRGDGDAASVDALARAVAAIATMTASGDPARGVSATRITGERPSAGAPRSPARRQLLIGAISAVPLAGAGVLAWRHFGGRGTTAAGNSVAVLPFDNLSGDAEQKYFSDGLSEEVRATLARNLALQVMAKSSSSRFEDGDYDATEIASELGVAFLLDGSVRRQGNAVRVVAELVDGRSGVRRWTDTFDHQLTDVFAVQSEIAYAVADALSAFVGGNRDDRESLAAVGGTRNPIALDAYLRGRALYDLSTGEDTDRAALRLLELALENDPGFASAHAARARTLTAIANEHGKIEELLPLYAEAVAAAERAIALAPMLAEAHSTLGFTLFQGRLDARAARAPFERSVQLGAGEATVLARFAQYAARCGRHDDAARAMAPARVRDPLNPLIHRAAGGIAYAARRFEDSLAPLREALSMNPKLSHANAAIGDALLNLGDLDGALEAYGQERNGDMRRTGLAIAHHRAGDAAAAAQALDELRATGDRVLYQQAQVAAQHGRGGDALDALERARRLGDSGLIYSRNDPFLDPLRREPRFVALLDGLGFDASTAASA